MSDFTVNDTMAKIRYEIDEREIYNDIRSEIGTTITEVVLDSDTTYSWGWWERTILLAPFAQAVRQFDSGVVAYDWKFSSTQGHAYTMPYAGAEAYYDYELSFTLDATGNTAYVTIKNTGARNCRIVYYFGRKYLSADQITHEELVPSILTVRATDATSIRKYGRRVMNLTWTEGTKEEAMQTLVEHYLERYKDPVGKLACVIKGVTDTLLTQIITREISDIITVISSGLGLNADCFINTITISDDVHSAGTPVCTWGLEVQRSSETLTLFILDTSELDGPHVLGS